VAPPSRNSLHGILDRAVGRNHHNGERRVGRANLAEDVEAASARQGDIEKDEVKGLFGEAAQARLGGRGGGDIKAFLLGAALPALSRIPGSSSISSREPSDSRMNGLPGRGELQPEAGRPIQADSLP